ncbi:MAG: hypothetical protein LBR53_12865 [Deltaproteobacteria bacterium]|jgi:hypothetical protein|nr:hypothetical protein [Deltaproteobacteria bacterium]
MGSIANAGATPLPIKQPASRSLWREEMLGQLLSSMREHQNKNPQVEESAPAERPPRVFGKGYYVDLYV